MKALKSIGILAIIILGPLFIIGRVSDWTDGAEPSKSIPIILGGAVAIVAILIFAGRYAIKNLKQNQGGK